MKNIYLVITFLFFTKLWSQSATTTIYLIRHAEKVDNSADPELSEAGKARAAKWAQYFKDKPIDYFFVTSYKRTALTAWPIGEAQNKHLFETYDPDMPLMGLANKYRGKTLLIVGHSNTIPAAINELLLEKTYPDIPDNEFGYLYKITVTGSKITHELIKT
ncbi:histidine phosphatase family protein [Flavobacterium zepuense]|uniref:Histidine phosphatase family protein n=1 Tax=Flavobacterium zepuense TaxID=2593302 RepID=A0A552UYX2_9FLAO|nr:phosphoglycerate mutase family protein [Flavobacterium zepuense]TRW23401.1 histidine phosphatase family protein [Flavobacterium zepuense]